jgi:hypothetical protein
MPRMFYVMCVALFVRGGLHLVMADGFEREELTQLPVAIYGSCKDVDLLFLADDTISWFTTGFAIADNAEWVYILTSASSLGLDLIEHTDHDFLGMEFLTIKDYQIQVAIAGEYADVQDFLLDWNLGLAVLRIRNYGYSESYSVIPIDSRLQYSPGDIVVAVGKPLAQSMSTISSAISSTPGPGSHPETNFSGQYIIFDRSITNGMEGGPLFLQMPDSTYCCIGVLDLPRQAEENFGYAFELPYRDLTRDQYLSANAFSAATLIDSLYGTEVQVRTD